MNKIEFEAYLRNSLSILQGSEINEIVSEYLQHIDLKIAEGATEEEAIKDFGDLDELVSDLLDAYKINQEPRDFKNFEKKAKSVLNSTLDFINNIASALIQKSATEIIGLVVQFILVIILMIVVNSLIESVAYTLSRVFYFRPYFLTNIIRAIIHLVKTLITFTISISVLYWFAKDRIISENTVSKTKVSKNNNLHQSVERKVDTDDSQQVNNSFIELERKTIEIESDDDFVSDIVIEEKENNLMDAVRKINLTAIKIVLLLILIPMIVVGVLLGFAFVTLLIATFSGYGSLGITIIGTGFLLMYYSATIALIKFVGGNKK